MLYKTIEGYVKVGYYKKSEIGMQHKVIMGKTAEVRISTVCDV